MGMADNRLYVYCRWCRERSTGHFGHTLARFGYGHEWKGTAENFATFVEEHMHRDEPQWWTDGYMYNPFDFEYEETNEQREKTHEKTVTTMRINDLIESSKD